MIIYPSGTVVVPKVTGLDNFIETALIAQDIPLTTTGTAYLEFNISGTNVQSAFDDLVDNLGSSVLDIAQDTGEPTGFIDRISSTISFDNNTRTFTIAPTGSSFDIYAHGIKFNKTTSSGQVPNVTENYFFYYTASGVFTQSTTPWNLLSDVPIAMVYWNSTISGGILLEERHGIVMDSMTHYHLHNSRGAFVINGFGIADYVEDTGSPTSGTNTFSLADGTIADEDLIHSISTLADGGPYSLFYRTGINGEWLFNTGQGFPYYKGPTYIQYNQLNGGNWQLTNLINSEYTNYYVFATNAIDTNFKHIIIPGQSVYSNEANATNESIFNLTFGTLPFVELAPLYQITFHTSASFSNSIGSCRIVNVKRIVGTNISITSNFNVGDHSALSGRSTANSHPVTAISTTVSGAVLHSLNNTISEDPRLIWNETTATLTISGNLGTYSLPVSTIHATNLNTYNNTTISGMLKFHSNTVPISGTSPGDEGEIRYDEDFIYIKLGGVWRRSDMALF